MFEELIPIHSPKPSAPHHQHHHMYMKYGMIWLYIIQEVKSKTVKTKCPILREYPEVSNVLGRNLVYTGNQMHHFSKNISFPGKQTKYKIHNENALVISQLQI